MLPFEAFLETLETGSGFWNPLVWVTGVVVALLIAYIVRGYGNKEYKKDTDQTQSFLSGNPEYEKEQMHVKGQNLFWGFTESLKWVYKALEKFHTGIVNDYILWFVIIMAVFFIILGVL
ncbi:MAG: hydrogenase [Candidatus Thermoplasmatota archaeon]